MRNSITFAVLFLLTVTVHTFHLSFASYDLDEAVHIWHAQKPYSEVIAQSANDPNPPVYDLAVSWWVKHVGVDEWTTRFLSVLMGALAVGLLFIVGAGSFGYRVGVLAAVLLCFSPMLFRFTHLARPYTMLLVAVIGSYGLLLEQLKKPSGWKLLAYMLTTALMIYVHPTAIFNLPAQALFVLIVLRKDFKHMLALYAAMILAAVSFGAWYVMIPYFHSEVTMWFGAPNWADVQHVLNMFYGGTYLQWFQGLVLLAIVGRYLRGAFVITWDKFLFVLLWMIVPMAVSIAFSHLVKPVFQDKYVLSVLPAIVLFLAATLDVAFRGKYILLPAACVLFLGCTAINVRPQAEENWRQAIAYIKQDFDENTAVYLSPWYELRSVAFYFDRKAYMVPDSTEKYLVKDRVFWTWHDVVPTGSNRPRFEKLYLVTAHGGYVQTGIDTDSLNRASTLLDDKTFSGVRVRYYRIGK